MYEDDEPEEEGRFRRRQQPPAKRGFLSRLGLWLAGAAIAGLVPLAIALWALSAAEDYAPFLKQPTAAGAAGSAAVVALAFSIALFLELYIYWKMGPSAGRDDDAPITGRWQFLIIYVLVPLVPGLIVGYLRVVPATLLSQTIDWIRQPSGLEVERQVGQAIRGAMESETRVAGLRALGQFGSPEALAELERLSTGDPQRLSDDAYFDALAGAIASFGSLAEPALLRIWKERGRTPAGAADERTPADVVLAAYNRLEPIADTASAYALAREAATAPASSAQRQAAAIALVAKTGSKSDVPWLASFLVNRPEPVTRAALDGLRQLDARLRKQEATSAAKATNAAPAGR